MTTLDIALSYLKRTISVIPLWSPEMVKKNPSWDLKKSLQDTLRKNREGINPLPEEEVIEKHVISQCKQPLVPWKEYQTRLPTEDEVRQWFTAYPDANIAIVTGRVSNLVVFDLDSNHAVEYAEEQGGFPDTVKVRTGKGYHMYMKYPGFEIKNTVNKNLDIDIRGEGGYVVAPPSVHGSGHSYAWEEGYSLSEIDPAECTEWMIEYLKDINSDNGPETETKKAALEKEFENIEKTIDGEDKYTTMLKNGCSQGERNDSATKLIGHLFSSNLKDSEIWEIAKTWNQKNSPPLDERELKKTFDSIRKRELQSRQSKKKEEYSAYFETLVDLVLDKKDTVSFLVKGNNRLVIKESQETKESILIPPKKDKIPWLIPRGSEVIRHFTDDTDSKLFEDLVRYHASISELPNEDHYRLLATWVMHTYLFDKVKYSPYLWLYAIPERGKSRTGEGLTYVSWRGIATPALSEAHIIRMSQNLKATIFFDVENIMKIADSSQTKDILLKRYEKGAKIMKVLHMDKGPLEDYEFFDFFGPTVVATNQPVDYILATRALEIVMPESQRDFEDDVTEIAALSLRERLVAFRARWLEKDLPCVDKPNKKRLGDILRPLRQIARIISQDDEWFLRFSDTIDVKRKESKTDTQEARVLTAIVKARKHTSSNGHLSNKDILDAYNEGRDDFKMQPKSLGWITKRLGFEKYAASDGSGIIMDCTLLKTLCQNYGVTHDVGD